MKNMEEPNRNLKQIPEALLFVLAGIIASFYLFIENPTKFQVIIFEFLSYVGLGVGLLWLNWKQKPTHSEGDFNWVEILPQLKKWATFIVVVMLISTVISSLDDWKYNESDLTIYAAGVYDVGDNEMTKKILTKSIEIYYSKSDTSGVLNSLWRLALLEEETEDYDPSSNSYYDEISSIIQEYEGVISEGLIYRFTYDYLINKGRFRAAHQLKLKYNEKSNSNDIYFKDLQRFPQYQTNDYRYISPQERIKKQILGENDSSLWVPT